MARVASTSRVFEAALAARDRLKAADLPRRASTPDQPVAVSLSQSAVNTHAERITVVPQVGDDGSISDAASPGHREERFTLTFAIEVDLYPDEDAAIARAEELADAVQQAFYLEDRNVPRLAHLMESSVDLDRITAVRFTAYEAEPGQFTVDATVEYEVVAMI